MVLEFSFSVCGSQGSTDKEEMQDFASVLYALRIGSTVHD
jgi:hypothetical protein